MPQLIRAVSGSFRRFRSLCPVRRETARQWLETARSRPKMPKNCFEQLRAVSELPKNRMIA
eukprot:4565933-Alexandrium_andersonii.AAC.1